MDKYHKLFKDAVDKWGVDAQLNMVIEECAELIQAVTKVKRHENEKTIDNLIEEAADVEIMLSQLNIMYMCGQKVYLKKLEKMKRLRHRIDMDIGE